MLVASGCGGSSSSSQISPLVAISWPDRTREFDAPKLAESATITLTPAGTNPQPLVWSVDRPSVSTGGLISYKGPDTDKSGPATLLVQFKSQTGGQGNIVGYASISVIIQSDGTILDSQSNPLGSIGFTSNLTSLLVNVDDTPQESTSTVHIYGYTSDYQLTALPSEGVSLTEVNGSGAATLDGLNLLGIYEGQVTINASCDGVTGSGQVNIVPHLANAVPLAEDGNDWAYDGVTGTSWHTIGSRNILADYEQGGGTDHFVGQDPTIMAMSLDGTKIYYALEGSNSIQPYDVATGTPGTPISLPTNQYHSLAKVTSLSVNPANPNEVAVCAVSTVSSGTIGPFVIRDGVVLPNYPGSDSPTSSANSAVYVNGTDLLTIDSTNSGFMGGHCTVDSNGVNAGTSQYGVANNWRDMARYKAPGIGYTTTGRVFNAYDFSNNWQINWDYGVGEMSFPVDVCTDTTSQLAWCVFYPGINTTGKFVDIRVVDLQSHNFISYNTANQRIYFASGQPETVRTVARIGVSGLVVQTDKYRYTFAVAPGLS
ncbi:MAG: hypothetical protein JST12_17515 [Armatimonadetes bacterium]|nr:hypothetical protein [Armatimonadota bacterium]